MGGQDSLLHLLTVVSRCKEELRWDTTGLMIVINNHNILGKVSESQFPTVNRKFIQHSYSRERRLEQRE